MQGSHKDLLSNLAREFLTADGGEEVDIITFVEASWGLGLSLLPAQKFILKCAYGMPLDNRDKYIEVPDVINEHILYRFTEREFLAWLYAEGRCNVDETEGKIFQEFVWSIGRRGGKCRYVNDIIATTKGSLTFGKLLERKASGENIGIFTYDPVTLRRKITEEFTVWDNGIRECFELRTKRGVSEVSSGNHPYLVWRDDWDRPKFLELSQLCKGDRIAVSAALPVFGKSGVGGNRAKLLGYYCGDGGISAGQVNFTNVNDEIRDEYCSLLAAEFPKYKNNKYRNSFRTVKDSGRNKQDGSQKNLVMEWLREEGIFGCNSYEKHIPVSIFCGSKYEAVCFLSRLFACDGWASTETKVLAGRKIPGAELGYCSVSKSLIQGVRHLLLKFGIHCVVSKKKATCNGKTFDAWKLCIRSKDDILKFADSIGIFGKQDQVDRVVRILRNKTVCNNAVFRNIPRGIWRRICSIAEKRGLTRRDIVGGTTYDNKRLCMKYCPNREKVAIYGKNIGDDFVRDIGSSDVFWDTVGSVNYVGCLPTVDLEVAGTHIIGGDILSHNSTLAAAVSDYELYRLVRRGDPSEYYGFPALTKIHILNVAPADDQADTVFEMTKTFAMHCPYLKNRVLHNTQSYFDVQTDPDIETKAKLASLVALSGGCSSNTLRGKNSIIVVMDEMAFFIDNAGRFSGTEVYKALTPSISSFQRDGKVLCISSPYAKYGAFYDRFVYSFEQPDLTLTFKMYSSMANPTIPTEILAASRRRDRSSFMSEYGGEFSDSVLGWVDDENELRGCITLPEPPKKGMPDVEYFMGIDLGFKNDGTALAIVHKDNDRQKICLDYADVWYSGSSDVWEMDNSIYHQCDKYSHLPMLQMSDIISEIKDCHRWFPLKGGIFDQHNGYALGELLRGAMLSQIKMQDFNDILNCEVYRLLKRLYAEGILELYKHPVLIPEMLTLEAERKSPSRSGTKVVTAEDAGGKGKIIVRAPHRTGCHDDITDAVARAVWKCYSASGGKGGHVIMGPGGRVVGKVSRKAVTPHSFKLNRLKKHGDHPRGHYRTKQLVLSRGY